MIKRTRFDIVCAQRRRRPIPIPPVQQVIAATNVELVRGTGVRDILFAWDDGRAAAAAPSDESAAPSDMCSLALFQAIFTFRQGANVRN